MAVKDWLQNIFGEGVVKVVDSVFSGIDKFVTSDEDKQKLLLLKAQSDLELQKLAFQAEMERLKDVQSARVMYVSDNKAQKWIAFAFVIAYFFLTALLLGILTGWFGMDLLTMPDWSIALISTLFGAMSTKVTSIVDFYFGSSQGSRNKDDSFANDVKTIMEGARTEGKDVTPHE